MFSSSRIIGKLARARVSATRKFSLSSIAREAQLFDMPSMSPTMEEGGIVEWKVKEGDAFSAGDVLLEIETDKAEIAVEAGDDGILAKIMVENGAKGIPVGQPIAITAEEGDDIKSIDIDALLSKKGSSAPPKEAEKPKPSEDESSKKPAQPESSPSISETAPSHGSFGLEPLPTALRLIHEHHLNASDIQGSGPHGRIVKGDVLAHLGKISKSYVAEEQTRFKKLQKLDFSAVKPAAAKPAGTASGADTTPASSASDAAQSNIQEKAKPLLSTVSIPLDSHVVAKVASAQRIALRQALLSLRPKPSILRDPALDSLTASAKPPFVIKQAKVTILRARPVSFDVIVEEPPAAQPSKSVDVFFRTLKDELALSKASL